MAQTSFLAVHGDFCKGKRPLQQRKWMESLSLFECQNAFKETVAFQVPFVSLWLCCFGRVVALKEIREYMLYRRF